MNVTNKHIPSSLVRSKSRSQQNGSENIEINNEEINSSDEVPINETIDQCEDVRDVAETEMNCEVSQEESESENSNSCPQQEINGRRIVDLQSFIQKLQKVSRHNGSQCSFDHLRIQKETRNGFHSKIKFICDDCERRFNVRINDNEKTTSTLCVNKSAVLGANLIGIGFSQLEQMMSAMEIPTMCNDKFKDHNDELGELWIQTAEKLMKDAAEEESLAAIKRGDVDPEDGIPFITVVADACWAKRSYNRNFTSLSGVGAIVGAHTGRVLWIGARNKYCVTCVRTANQNIEPPDHVCTRNFTGPSSEMEWDSILEGFKSSVSLYNLRFMKLISDGDSSTYSKLLEHKPYQDRHIEKIDCVNHLHRNFRKAIEAAVKGCPRGLNRHVMDNLERIRKDICCAIQFRKKENKGEDEKVSLLKSDLQNILYHVFGDHTNCPNYIKSFCKNDEDYVPSLKACNTFEKMSAAIRQLMYSAKDLILGESNNVAEQYNSIVAKFVGGKRVNFALSNAYKFKANAAVVQFNSGTPVSALYETIFKQSPPSLAKKIEVKRLRKTKNAKERRITMKKNRIVRVPFSRVKQAGPGYGPNCQRPDLSPEDFETEKVIFMEKLNEYHANRKSNEIRTRDKNQSSLWNEIAGKVILSKNFGLICKGRAFASHVKELTQKQHGETKAMKHQNQSLSVAIQQLEKEQDITIRECGMYIDDDHKFLAASPSGMVIVGGSDMMIYVLCPFSIYNLDPNDMAVLGNFHYYLYVLLLEQNREEMLVLSGDEIISERETISVIHRRCAQPEFPDFSLVGLAVGLE